MMGWGSAQRQTRAQQEREQAIPRDGWEAASRQWERAGRRRERVRPSWERVCRSWELAYRRVAAAVVGARAEAEEEVEAEAEAVVRVRGVRPRRECVAPW